MIVLELLSWALLSAGVWKILVKCGKPGWPALIPGYRYYKLAECTGNEADGAIVFMLEIASRLFSIMTNLYPEKSNAVYFLALLIATMTIIQLVLQIRIAGRLCFVFAVKRYWVVLWALLPGIAAMIWGFSSKFKPVRLGVNPDKARFAGTKPAPIQAAVDEHPTEEGLTIHLKARTANDFSKKRYLLKDINLTIPPGSLVLLLGGSGSGKTTLVNAIIGYEPADAYINLNGKDIYKEYDEMKYRIGFVPQQELLRDCDTVIRTLQDAAALRLPVQVGKVEMEEKIDNVMDVLGIGAGKEGLVSKKSGGQKKRISIGMELISDPDLFILDEPDSGLDGVIARELFERLREIADQGKIVIAITHTPDRVIDLFDKVIVLARDSGRVGRLAFYGTPDEARKFFGKDTMENVVMAVNEKSAGGEGRADEFIEKYALATAQKGEQVS